MSIFLNHSPWIWLLLLGVVPLLVHLLSRSRPAVFEFSDLTFLRNIVKKTSRYRKPKDRVVLILRTLAALVLLFAFLHPLFVSRDPSVVVGAKNHVVYMIDRSASMSAVDGSTSRFTDACSKVASMISKTAPDNANVVWIRSIPTAEFPAPGPNVKYLAERLQGAEVSMENGAIASSFKLAIDQLNKVKGNREIIVVSDFQRQAWENVDLFVPDSIKLTKVQVGEDRLPNIGIDSLTAQPAAPVKGQKVYVTVKVKNYSDNQVTTTVYLNAGGGRQSKQVEIAANGQAGVEFNAQFNQHGDIGVTASLGEDSFRGDDERHMILPIKEAIRLVSVASAAESATVRVLDRVAGALPWLTHERRSDIPGGHACEVLFLHDWGGENLNDLVALSEAGTSVIVVPSSKAKMSDLQRWLDLAPVDTVLSQRDDPKGWKAMMAKESAAVFSIFSSGEFGNPAQGIFRERYELPKQWGNAAIIHYTDGVPGILLSEREQSSRLIWNLSFDPAHSDWLAQEPFLSFMAELFLSIQPEVQSEHDVLMAGSRVGWVLPESVDAQSLTLVRSGKDELETKTVQSVRGLIVESVELAEPGMYAWKTGSTVAHQSVVNFPVSESDLTLVDPDDLASGETADQEDVIRAGAMARGMPMWPWLLGAVMLLLIGESFAARTKQLTQSTTK